MQHESRTLQQAMRTSNRQIVYGTRFHSLLPLMRFSEESGYISLIVFENDDPMCSSPVVKYPSSFLMNSSCSLCALCIRFLRRHSEALGGPIFAVPLARVITHEEIPAMLAEVDRERVRLHAVAVPLECAPLLELGIGTESALDLTNRSACPVACVATSRAWYPVLKSFGISK